MFFCYRLKTVERRSVFADSNRQTETKAYLPDWLEPKPKPKDTGNDYIQDNKIAPTDESGIRHGRSRADKIQEVKTLLLIYNKKNTHI